VSELRSPIEPAVEAAVEEPRTPGEVSELWSPIQPAVEAVAEEPTTLGEVPVWWLPMEAAVEAAVEEQAAHGAGPELMLSMEPAPGAFSVERKLTEVTHSMAQRMSPRCSPPDTIAGSAEKGRHVCEYAEIERSTSRGSLNLPAMPALSREAIMPAYSPNQERDDASKDTSSARDLNGGGSARG